MRPVFGTSFTCALMFLDGNGGVAGAIDGAVGVGSWRWALIGF